jgi:hypothetical protein
MPDMAPSCVAPRWELQGASDEAIEAELAAGPDDPQPLTDEEVAERDRLLEVLTALQSWTTCSLATCSLPYNLYTCDHWLRLPIGWACFSRYAAVSTASTELLLDGQGLEVLTYPCHWRAQGCEAS